MGKLSTCRGHAVRVAHAHECGVGWMMRVIDVCAGGAHGRLTLLHEPDKACLATVEASARPPPAVADAPGADDESAGEGRQATVG